MTGKPTYEELEQRIAAMEKEILDVKTAEDELRRREERAQLFLEQTGVGMVHYSPDGEILWINAVGASFLGCEVENAVGKTLFDFFEKSAAAKHVERIKRVASSGVSESTEELISLPTGEVNWFFSDYSRVVDKFGNVIGTQIIAQNITKLKKAEEELREREEKLRFIYENVNEEIVYLDSQGTYLDLNKKVEDIFGYKPEEAIGKNFFDIPFCRPEYVENISKLFSQAFASGPTNLIEFVGKRRDGTEVYIEASSNAIQKDDGTKNIIGVVRDVTERKLAEKERKRLEDELRQAQKMEAIGTLAGGIAHEFNNILGIIVGNTELAMGEIPEWNTAHYNLEEILTASLRARDIVRQILAFSRRTQQDLKPVCLSTIITESVRLLRSSIPTTIEIQLDISSRSDIIKADKTQINQILINLCANAAHAMRNKGGILSMSLENVELDEDAAKIYNDLSAGDYVKLTVSDTGSGINQASLNHIFDPFYTTKKVGEGTGMGLSVVHGIVKTHDGEITVQSEIGKGTTFEILFPVVEDAAKPEPESKETLKGCEKILFVDDDKSLLFAAEHTFGKLGYEITTKQNPIEALALFEERPNEFDLVITDMTMPEMTGDRFAKEIMKIKPDMPIIICTGYSEQMSEEQAGDIGIRAFVMKPYLAHEIAATTRLVLDKK